MDDWLQTVTDSLVEATGVDAASLALPSQDRRVLLELARIAAHASGQRTNAPLLCYVLGLAAARGAPLTATAPVVQALDTDG